MSNNNLIEPNKKRKRANNLNTSIKYGGIYIIVYLIHTLKAVRALVLLLVYELREVQIRLAPLSIMYYTYYLCAEFNLSLCLSVKENIVRKPARFCEAKKVDVVATVIGDFGLWQLKLSLMMALLKFPIAWYQLNIIFLAPPQEFWCVKPKEFSQYSVEKWRDMCAPRIEEFPCLIFDPEILIVAPTMNRALIPLVECHEFDYDQSVFLRTITSDWDLVCTKRWLVHFTQCTIMFGILLGGLVFGVIADKYGRKSPLMISILIQGLASYAVCFMFNFWAFLFNSFVLAIASGGVGIISFVMTMEVVSGKWRTIIPVLYQLPFGLGNPVMAGLAYWLRDWRKLMCALSTMSSIFLIYWPFISESPRWLLAKGDECGAYEVLKAAAEVNKMKFEEKSVERLIANAPGKVTRKPGFVAFLKSKNMRLKTLLLSVNWFCTGLAFYTFSQYLGGIGDDIFYTVTISGLISTPGAIVCVFIILKMGRKVTVAIFELTTAFCFVFILLIPKDSFPNDWPRIMFAGIGFGGMAGSVPALFLYSGELYPTLGRNVGVSGVSTFARIGSMVAPLVASLNDTVPDLPIVILAVTSFAQILLLLPLPETMNQPLPDTLEQAEQFSRYATGAKKKYGLFD